MLRSVKSSAADALTKALDDAAKQAETEKKATVAALEADLKNAKDNLEQAKSDAEKHTQELLSAKDEAHEKAIAAIEKRHAEAMEAMEKRHAEAIEAERKRYEQALATMKEQVQNATNQMLKERQAELQQSNSTNMKMIVDPLKESIAKMESALKENKSTQETSTEAIKEKIATLVSTTMKVSDSAERLSNALTAENKTQGNWGEQKIETLLNAIGLERGLEYDAQEYLRDANGNIIVSDETTHRMQPDIILHLDETRDLIIDSKVSLNAFVDYTNAEDDDARAIALASHLKSVRNHVKELAKKNYAAYVKAPRQSVDFVMMFVPVDAALQLALASDATLWRDAMNQGVFIVGEQNMYAALRAVQVTWTAIKQNANNKAICDTAEELLTRVGDLLERVQKVGKKLDEAKDAYNATLDKAETGRMTVLGSARKLVKLGAKVSTVHPLPQHEADEDQTRQLSLGDSAE
ncbi:MAG: DNA recombination protein RmuC [Paludibacteraceae bacterium]|nr:DNA recombination protein RmuC [Paludibacteraceae bacterium]